MSDNALRISFNYKKPDEAALVVYTAYGSNYYGGPRINIVKALVGEKAIAMYSELTGKTIDEIEKRAIEEEEECCNG